MNSLVFNTVANQLKTSVYAYNNSTSSLQLMQLNATGELLVAGDMTISNTLLTVTGTVSGNVTVTNTLLTVAGTVSGDVTVSNTLLTVTGTVSGNVTVTNTLLTVAGDVTVANTLLTVTGTVSGNVTVTNTLLTVAGDVTVANTLLTVTGTVSGNVTVTNTLLTVAGTVSGNVTISNTLLTVLVEGNMFTSDVKPYNSVTSTGIALPATDISKIRTASMLINNTGTNPITITLQLSPDGTTYFDDPAVKNIALTSSAYTLIVLGTFLKYAQIAYDAGATNATFVAYYNGQA